MRRFWDQQKIDQQSFNETKRLQKLCTCVIIFCTFLRLFARQQHKWRRKFFIRLSGLEFYQNIFAGREYLALNMKRGEQAERKYSNNESFRSSVVGRVNSLAAKRARYKNRIQIIGAQTILAWSEKNRGNVWDVLFQESVLGKLAYILEESFKSSAIPVCLSESFLNHNAPRALRYYSKGMFWFSVINTALCSTRNPTGSNY